MRRFLTAALLLSFLISPLWADARKAKEKVRKAEVEYARKNIAGAEKLLRQAIEEDPNSVDAHSALGDLLSATQRNSQAAREYGKALELDDQQKVFTPDQRRRHIDQQGITTALGGDLEAAKKIYLDALAKDPDYAFFNYNLSCVYAEQGDLDSALAYLKKAWEHRDNIPAGQKFPDPRQDSSFKAFLNDKRFQQAVQNMVL
jgi:tetratricopeptide (TPR) repeat protein